MIAGDDIVWFFDGRHGMGETLQHLLMALGETVSPLLPPSIEQPELDAFAALEADASFEATKAVEGIRLERLFPRHVDASHDKDDAAREAMLRGRATSLYRGAYEVFTEIEEAGEIVPVKESSVNTWLQVLGALRASWHAEFTGSSDRLATPTQQQYDEDPIIASLLDWLAYMMESLLESRDVCYITGEGLDPESAKEWR